MTFVSDFEPQPLWRHFDKILTIPRGSKNEEQMRRYVISVAERAGLKYKQDETGNVVVQKPATKGREKGPITILQAHLDMVNENNSDVAHDFDKDPIIPRQEGEYLYATGTTLGSDNGIGVAAMLALMESKDAVHGPLEFLFTIDEETGLTGATQLADGMLQGRCLLNLDSEDEGILTIGCAGGADSDLSLPLDFEAAPSGASALKVSLSGLKGGHSGVDIHLQRGNAVQLLTRAVFAASLNTPLRVAELQGGNKHNAIPREASATLVAAEAAQRDALRNDLIKELEQIQKEFRPAEPGMQFKVAEASVPSQVWTADTTQKALSLVNALPHGVMSMSYEIPSLVETSTNLAAVRQPDHALNILMSSRSSVASALEALRRRIRSAALLAGAKVEEGNGYPGWKPDVDSKVLKVVERLHEKVLGSKPEVTAVHAGLECGIIGEKYPGMDMISFGPQIEAPHSPDERVKIPTVADFFKLLQATLEELGKG